MPKEPFLRAESQSFAVDHDGKPLPFTPAQVNQITMKAIDEGTIMAVVYIVNGDLAVQVFGPPSRETAAMLRQAADAYEGMFKQG